MQSEITLFDILKIIKSNVYSITLIISFFVLTGIALSFVTEKKYDVFLSINPISLDKETNLKKINLLAKRYAEKLNIDEFESYSSEELRKLFIAEFNNYAVLSKIIYVELKNNISLQKNFTGNNKPLGDIKLKNFSFDLAKSVQIIQDVRNKENHSIQFKSSQPNEILRFIEKSSQAINDSILSSMLTDVEESLNAKIFDNTLSISELEGSKNVAILTYEDELGNIINHLKEQSQIAQKLNLKERESEEFGDVSFILGQYSEALPNVSKPDYLSGYDALQAEIELLENRRIEDIYMYDETYRGLVNQIRILEFENEYLKNEILKLPDIFESSFQTVELDVRLAYSNISNKISSLTYILILSFILGSFVSMFYVYLVENQKK